MIMKVFLYIVIAFIYLSVPLFGQGKYEFSRDKIVEILETTYSHDCIQLDITIHQDYPEPSTDQRNLIDRRSFYFCGDHRWQENFQQTFFTQTVVRNSRNKELDKEGEREYTTQRTLRLFDGDSIYVEHDGEVSRYNSELAFAHQTSSFGLIYLDSLGWYIEDPTAPPEINRFHKEQSLPQLILNARDLKIQNLQRGNLEAEGNQSELLKLTFTTPFEGTIAKHQIWLSISHNLLPARRIAEFDDEKIEIEFTDYFQAEKTFWLPQNLKIKNYKKDNLNAWKIKSIKDHHMKSVKIGENEDLHEYSAKPGYLYVDFVTTKERGIPLNKPLNRIISADGKLIIDSLDDVKRSRFSSNNSIYAIIAINLFLLIIFIWILYKRRNTQADN